MNGLACLPTIPDSALDGMPPAADLPTPALRRRYAQAVTMALLGEPSWQITLWPRWQMPRLLVLRAEQEDWPALGNASVAALLQPAPLPDDPAALQAKALLQVRADMRAEIDTLLTHLWAGDLPEPPRAEVHRFLAQLVTEAGIRAAREADAAADAATEGAEGTRPPGGGSRSEAPG